MKDRKLVRGIGIAAAGFFIAVAAGCGPIVFSDGNALAVNADAPEPEAAPEPEPEPEPPKRVEVRNNKIVINEKVQFEHASAKIQSVSHSLLDEVAQAIKDNPQIKKIEVQGHASSEGKDSYNLKLSDQRANAVRDYLVGNGGIADKKLSAKGYGEAKPIADNETEEGRETNRRVEFLITKQKVTKTKVEVDDEGNETVVSESSKMRGKDAKKKKKKKKKDGDAEGGGKKVKKGKKKKKAE